MSFLLVTLSPLLFQNEDERKIAFPIAKSLKLMLFKARFPTIKPWTTIAPRKSNSAKYSGDLNSGLSFTVFRSWTCQLLNVLLFKRLFEYWTKSCLSFRWWSEYLIFCLLCRSFMGHATQNGLVLVHYLNYFLIWISVLVS